MNLKCIGYRGANDPISVSLKFKCRFESFTHNVLFKEDGPLGKVTHYFVRVEYQARGAPHVHCKVWIKDAPVIGRNSDAEILQFINDHVSCSVPSSDCSPCLHDLVNRFQMHTCSASCMSLVKDKKENFIKRSRHGFPRKISEKNYFKFC